MCKVDVSSCTYMSHRSHKEHMEVTIFGVTAKLHSIGNLFVIFNATRLETGCYDVYKPQNMIVIIKFLLQNV